MIAEYTLRLKPQDAHTPEVLRQSVCREKGLSPEKVHAVQVIKRSIDARQRQVCVQLQVKVFLDEDPGQLLPEPVAYGSVADARPVVVVGAGPAGLFAALRLIELGRKPIVVERGKDVSQRKKDLAESIRSQRINPESNYCFGEGGAGAYSDGKLYTRSKKRGNVESILRTFYQFGATAHVLTDAHPHIGTDRLPRIIANIRQQILDSGGEVHFETLMTDLLIENGEVRGIRCRGGEVFHGPVILATGHSARDVYRLMMDKGLPLQAKGFAMGVRLEHPQTLIDRLMYHSCEGRGEYLPAAEYNFVQQVEGRGVYSFCMCPGGFIVPASQEDGLMVVNGMSPSHRGSKWANSGMVVEIRPEDIAAFQDLDIDSQAPLPQQMLQLQMGYERLTFGQGGGGLVAPAQRMDDFVRSQASKNLPSTSYVAGLQASRLDQWMPAPIRSRLQAGFKLFDRQIPGFLCHDATLIAAETRTSSPLRMPRDPENLNLLGVSGLYPCGEGAGYAGGIVSSAIDGQLCAEKAAAQI